MTKQTSKKAAVKPQSNYIQTNSENSQSSLRQVPSEELKIVAQDGLATEHLVEHSPTETKRPRTGEDRESQESPIIVTDLATPVEDRPLSPNSEQRIQGDLAKLTTEIDEMGNTLEELNRAIDECEKALENVPKKNSHEYRRRSRLLDRLCEKEKSCLKEKASLQEQKASLQKLEVIIQERLAAREKSSDLPVLNKANEKVEKLSEVYRLSIERRFECDNTFGWEGQYCVFSKELAHHVFRVDESILLHRRDAVTRLYKLLVKTRFALVRGPPGAGKSTSIFAMALQFAKEKKGSVAWIQAQLNILTLITESKISVFKLVGNLFGGFRTLQQFLEPHKAQLIVIDQCRLCKDRNQDSDFAREMLMWHDAEMNTNHRFYVITSDGCAGYKNVGLSEKDLISLDPWTEEEYMKVLENDIAVQKLATSLGRTVDRQKIAEMARLKFYYAGISARFFFEYTIDQIMGSVKQKISEVHNWDDVVRGQVGPASPFAVNLLFYARSQGGLIFSSSYIMRALVYAIQPQRYTEVLKLFGSDPNRGAVGHVFQSFTTSMIIHQKFKPLGGDADTTVTIDMGDYEDSNDEVIKLDLWYNPRNTYTAGYDIFCVRGNFDEETGKMLELNIIFMQITCSTKHAFYPQHFATAATKIAAKVNGYDEAKVCRTIDIIFAVPEKVSGDFQPDASLPMNPLTAIDSRWVRSESDKFGPIQVIEVPESDEYRMK